MTDDKNSNFLATEVQLIVEDDLEAISYASKNLNPFLTYIKFVLTDDKPNANGHRIPKEEFSNLIRTGLYMPIKMASGEIADGHEGSTPLGVITHLKTVGNTIRGIAGLWNKERPADIAYIKDRYASGEPLDLSWEIGFEEAEEEVDEEFGYTLNLRGCVLRATTLVGIPAYGHGRTSITEVDSAETETKAEEQKEDYDVKEELERLQAENETLTTKIAELESSQLTEEDKAKLAEYDELKQFKDEVEAEAARLERLDEIKEKFSEAGIERDEEYFTENEDKLLALAETETLEFFISNLAVMAEEEEEDEDEADDDEEEIEEEEAGVRVPGIRGKQEPTAPANPKELARALRNSKKTKGD